jgi:hypothetical protein
MPDELERLHQDHISEYYRFLGKTLLLGHRKSLDYHKKKLIAAGVGFNWIRVFVGALATLWRLGMNPKSSLEKLLKPRDTSNLEDRRQRHEGKPSTRLHQEDTIG